MLLYSVNTKTTPSNKAKSKVGKDIPVLAVRIAQCFNNSKTMGITYSIS
jgi:hypothetical protein